MQITRLAKLAGIKLSEAHLREFSANLNDRVTQLRSQIDQVKARGIDTSMLEKKLERMEQNLASSNGTTSSNSALPNKSQSTRPTMPNQPAPTTAAIPANTAVPVETMPMEELEGQA